MVPSAAELAIQAARDGNLSLLKQISNELELRGVEGFKGRGLLHFAAGGGHLEVCKFLVEDSGFHVNSTSAEGETAILVASEAQGDGNLPVLRYILDRGGDPAMPDARGFTPLHSAAENGHYEAVRLLLSKGIPVDPLNHRGTPLIVAAAMGQDQVVKILLDHGADPNKLVHFDHSPLTMACCARSLKCMKLLTQAGADVNSRRPLELPVLMVAVNKGLTDIVKFLLEVGADPSIPDWRWNFPIMLAAGHEHRGLVEILFPQTKPILLFPDWSVDGIIRAMKYQSCEPQGSVEEQIAVAKSEGKEAFAKGDYVDAIYCYMLAITKNPHDATLFANRSLCWLRLREDCGHVFFKCKNARECWRELQMEDVWCCLVQCRTGKEVAEKIWARPPEQQLKIVVWLWRWWTARNKANASERVQTKGEVCSSVHYHLNEFAKLNGIDKQRAQPLRVEWRPPPEEQYKVNVDAAFSALTRKGGWGCVIRNSAGEVLDSGAGNIQRAGSALHAEALAALNGLERAEHLGMTRLILETDASNLGKALSTSLLDSGPEGALFRRIRSVMDRNFVSCSISICPRSCNRVADCLASHGVAAFPDGGRAFWCEAPDFVNDIVSGNLSGALGL